MNEVVTTEHQPTHQGRALMAPGLNVGSIAIETERAIAEVQGQLTLAKRFPRSMVAAHNDFLEACKSPEFAATAFYAVPNRGNGPSIRFAEEVARCYGNFDYGHRELSRSAGKSEIEVYAWDKEKNNRSTRQITVEHIRDTQNGPKPLRDQTDIDNRIANVASKQMRGRILALVPKALVAAGIAECKRTIAGAQSGTLEKPLTERIKGLCSAFKNYGVSIDRLEKYLGHKVDDITVDEFADLMGIGNALKDGAKASEFFTVADSPVDDAQPAAAAAIAAAAKKPEKQPVAQKRVNSAQVASGNTGKPMKDAGPQPEQNAASAAPQQTAEAAEQQETQIDEANAAASAAAGGGETDDVF